MVDLDGVFMEKLHKEAVYVLFRSKQRTEKKLGVTDEKKGGH